MNHYTRSRSYGLWLAVFNRQKLTTSSRDEPCSRTERFPIRLFSKEEFKPSICLDAEATLESF